MRRLRGVGGILAGCAMIATVAACTGPRTTPIDVDSGELAREQMRQREVALRIWVEDQNRLYEVGWRILGGGTNLCQDRQRWEYGFTLWNAQSADEDLADSDWVQAAIGEFQLSDRVRAAYVHSGFPAARSGLQAGDELELIEGQPVATGTGAIAKILERLDALAGGSGSPVAIRVRRGGAPLGFSVQPVAICDYDLVVERSGDLNAYADGEAVYVTQRMLEFARSDNELAVVVGHEFAHNAMGHIDAKEDNQTAGAIVGLIFDVAAIAAGVNTGGEFSKLGGGIGGDAYATEFESEADYVGLYVTARAGYDINVGADFWRRMAAENPDAITYASSHPTTSYRAAALDKVVVEISDKKRAGLPLEPEYMPEPKAAPVGPSESGAGR